MIKIGKMLEQLLSSLVRKPATHRYPYEKAVMPPNFRGKLKFYPEKCIGCKLCMKDCPSGAIQINKVGEAPCDTQPDVFAKPSDLSAEAIQAKGEAPSAQRLGAKEGEKRFEAIISLDKCIYCAQCVDTCPKNALAITPEFELAQLDRKNLKVVFPPPARSTSRSPPWRMGRQADLLASAELASLSRRSGPSAKPGPIA